MIALPALESLTNVTLPSALFVIVALPAVELFWNSSEPNPDPGPGLSLTKVAFPAVDVPVKTTLPFGKKASPAVALELKVMPPPLSSVTNVWVSPELFVMPAPLIVK